MTAMLRRLGSRFQTYSTETAWHVASQLHIQCLSLYTILKHLRTNVGQTLAHCWLRRGYCSLVWTAGSGPVLDVHDMGQRGLREGVGVLTLCPLWGQGSGAGWSRTQDEPPSIVARHVEVR